MVELVEQMREIREGGNSERRSWRWVGAWMGIG